MPACLPAPRGPPSGRGAAICARCPHMWQQRRGGVRLRFRDQGPLQGVWRACIPAPFGLTVPLIDWQPAARPIVAIIARIIAGVQRCSARWRGIVDARVCLRCARGQERGEQAWSRCWPALCALPALPHEAGQRRAQEQALRSPTPTSGSSIQQTLSPATNPQQTVDFLTSKVITKKGPQTELPTLAARHIALSHRARGCRRPHGPARRLQRQ